MNAPRVMIVLGPMVPYTSRCSPPCSTRQRVPSFPSVHCALRTSVPSTSVSTNRDTAYTPLIPRTLLASRMRRDHTQQSLAILRAGPEAWTPRTRAYYESRQSLSRTGSIASFNRAPRTFVECETKINLPIHSYVKFKPFAPSPSPGTFSTAKLTRTASNSRPPQVIARAAHTIQPNDSVCPVHAYAGPHLRSLFPGSAAVPPRGQGRPQSAAARLPGARTEAHGRRTPQNLPRKRSEGTIRVYRNKWQLAASSAAGFNVAKLLESEKPFSAWWPLVEKLPDEGEQQLAGGTGDLRLYADSEREPTRTPKDR